MIRTKIGGMNSTGNAQRNDCRTELKQTRFQRLCVAAAAVLLLLGGSALADFPPALVVSGSVYVQTKVSGSNAEYFTPNGVFVLNGESGGVAAWGDSEAQALTNPSSTGTWSNDYSQPISLSGAGGAYTITLPQVLLYLRTSGTAAMQGYDGNLHQPLGTGSTGKTGSSDLKYAIAYNGIPDGYIFKFSNGSTMYRYGPGGPATPLSISKNPGFPPSNVAIFPQQLVFNSGTLTKTSFSEGFENGYWGHIFYQGQKNSVTIYGDLHVYISGDGLIGEMWGTVENTSVNAQWNPATKMFIADPTLGASLSISSATPSHGPLQVAFHGALLPFRYTDAQGSNVYCNQNGGTWVTISSSNAVTASSAYSTVTGTYDPSSQSFSVELGDCAAVSADGTTLLGLPGISVCTFGWSPGGISFGSVGNVGPDYSLYRADGTAIFKYVRCPDGPNVGNPLLETYGQSTFLFQFPGSPIYQYNQSGNDMALDAIIGWPTPNVSNAPIFPARGYVNGSLINRTSLVGPYINGDLTTEMSIGHFFTYSGPSGSISGAAYTVCCNPVNSYPNYHNLGDKYAAWGLYASFLSDWGCYPSYYYFHGDYDSNGVPVPYDLPVSSGGFSIYSDDWDVFTVTFDAAPETPQVGPSQITWNGTDFQFSYTDNGADRYTNPNGVFQISISGSNVTVSGTHPATGTYNPQTYQFNFNGDPAMQTFLAQDANGNLLGTPAGLTMYSSGTQSGFGQSIQLGNTTVLSDSNTTVYRFKRADGSQGVKYIGIPQGSLFVVADASGNGTSPVYRYNPNGGDLVLNTGSNGAWPASNLYPQQLYVNGHYTSIDDSSQTTWTASSAGSYAGQELGGQVSYHVQPGGETLTLRWTWCAAHDAWGNYNFPTGFSASISGNYGSFGTINGTWDGGRIFAGLPSGLTINIDAPSFTARYGPPQIKWNGVELIYDPLASAASAANPQGADVYHDSLGLGLRILVGKDGAVTFYQADGNQLTGTYNPTSYQFTITGQSPGTVQADTTQGFSISSGRGTSTSQGTSIPTMEAPGNFDIQGNTFSFGNWILSGASMPGMVLTFNSASPSLLQFSAIRKSTQWTWSRADADGSSKQLIMMSLDTSNRLNLYPQTTGTATQVQPTITLDPVASGTSQIPGTVKMPGTVLINGQGDVEMGVFTNGPTPQ